MFANQEYLYLLLFVPVFFLLIVLRLKSNERVLKSYIQPSCLKVSLGFVSGKKKLIRYSLILLMFTFLILALARPQSLKKDKEQVEVKGAEVVILADVSNSMLVKDMGGLSRLDVMKKKIHQLVQLLSGQRVGLIAFAGSAELVSPLTLDHSSLDLFIKSLSYRGHLQGTDFGSALRSAWQTLKRGGVLGPEASSRVIVIASDGEDNERQALEVAKALADQKVRVFTLGFGTRKGGMIPVYTARGNIQAYKRDKRGDLVISRFNESTLKKIAHVTGGAYYSVSLLGNTIEKLYSDIQSVGDGAVSYQSQTVYREWYQYFVFISLFFGFLYFILGERKNNYIKQWHHYLEKKQ